VIERPPTLERLLRPVEPITLDRSPVREGVAQWLEGPDGWRLLATPRTDGNGVRGDEIERFLLPSGATVRATATVDGALALPFDLDEAYRNYVTEAWREGARLRQLSARQLKVYYRVKRLLPREFWLAVRRRYIRAGKRPAFPAWPLEQGVERLTRFYALCLLVASGRGEAAFQWFWPSGHHAALALTHDVESEPGLRLALELADLEEERGFRSSFNVVGAQYPVDHGILRELRARGFEIGVHGLRHDRSLFSSRSEFERQLPCLATTAERFVAAGFRSPATHRVVEWLSELPVAYDCTVPHSDPYEPQPGGCCSLWPFSLGEVVELPYTLPQDHLLFTLLGERSADSWVTQAEAIERRFGLIQCLSHPDHGYLGDPDKRAIYRDFLDHMAGRDRVWKALPREIANWWRLRDAGATRAPEQRLGTMSRSSSPEYAVLTPPPARVSTQTATARGVHNGSSRSSSWQPAADL
jgi:peptidoglycan/xylan/chitin deacetylase (PgdA/CDA1 family)